VVAAVVVWACVWSLCLTVLQSGAAQRSARGALDLLVIAAAAACGAALLRGRRQVRIPAAILATLVGSYGLWYLIAVRNSYSVLELQGPWPYVRTALAFGSVAVLVLVPSDRTAQAVPSLMDSSCAVGFFVILAEHVIFIGGPILATAMIYRRLHGFPYGWTNFLTQVSIVKPEAAPLVPGFVQLPYVAATVTLAFLLGRKRFMQGAILGAIVTFVLNLVGCLAVGAVLSRIR
jgi:hypothetical protein